MKEANPRDLPIAEAAARLGITPNGLRYRIHHGAIAARRNGAGTTVISEAELARHVAEWRPQTGKRHQAVDRPDNDQAAFAATFGERVARTMATNGVTRAQLVFALSSPQQLVAESDIRRWSSGKATPRAERLGSLADALGVTVDYLLGRTADPLGVVVPARGSGQPPIEIAGDALRELGSSAEQLPSEAASRTSRTSSRPRSRPAARRRKTS